MNGFEDSDCNKDSGLCMDTHGSADDEQMDTLPLPSMYEGNLDPATSKSTLIQPLVMETSIQPGVGSVERAHMEGHQLTSLLIV